MNEEPLRRADFPSQLEGLVAELSTAERGPGGYMLLARTRGTGHGPDDLVADILLDFVLNEAGALSYRCDFVAPPRDFLERISTGRLDFNDVEYELTWLGPDESAEIVERYDLHTWPTR